MRSGGKAKWSKARAQNGRATAAQRFVRRGRSKAVHRHRYPMKSNGNEMKSRAAAMERIALAME